MALNHKGIGLLLFFNFLFVYILYLLFAYRNVPGYTSVFLILSFIGFNVYIVIESINYIDTQDNNFAIPIVALCISACFLLLIVLLVIALFIAMIVSSNKESGGK